MNPEQQYQWTTPPTNNYTSMAAAFTTTGSTSQTTDHHHRRHHSTTTATATNTKQSSSNDHDYHTMELRQQQRINQMEDEVEHTQMCHDGQRELLQDTLHNLRQRIHDIEQDHWKYDIVR